MRGYKTHGSYFLDFTPSFATEIGFAVAIPKSEICRKIQDAVWECDPLLADFQRGGSMIAAAILCCGATPPPDGPPHWFRSAMICLYVGFALGVMVMAVIQHHRKH